jgi:hypothetical protein
MADSILRLKVESQEYDNKLKQAAQGLTRYADECRKVGGTLEVVEKETLDYVRAIGQMDTTSRTATGKLAEMKKAFVEFSAQYKQMTDAEKQSPFGKALAASLDQLKGRIVESKSQLDEINKSINGGGGLTGALDNLAGKFGMSIQSLTGWGAAIAAAKGALDVAKDAFFASEATVDEWGRVMDSSKSLYEGFLTALNTGDISGYLSRIDSIVQAARAAYNELDRLGTMKTIQAPQMSAQQTENERMRMMIQTGRYIAPVDGRRASMQNGQLLTPEQIQRIEQQLQNGMQKVVTLVGNEVTQTSKAIDAVYNRQAQELGMSLKEFRKGTSSMAEFDKRIKGAEDYRRYEREHTTYDERTGIGHRDASVNPFEQFAKWSTFRVDGQRYNDLVKLIQQRDQQAGQAYSMQSQAYRTMNRAEGVTLRQIMGGGSGGGRSGGGKTTTVKTEEQLNNEEIQKLTQEYIKASDDRRKAIEGEIKTLQDRNKEIARLKDMALGKIGDDGSLSAMTQQLKDLQSAQSESANGREWDDYQKKIDDVTEKINVLKGVLPKDQQATFTVEVNAEQLEQLRMLLPNNEDTVRVNVEEGTVNLPEIPKEDETIRVNITATTADAMKEVRDMVGEIEGWDVAIEPKIEIDEQDLRTPFEKLKDSLKIEIADENMQVDTTTLQTLMKTTIQNGIDGLDPNFSALQEKMREGMNIPDETWQALQDEINEKLKELGIEPIKIDFKTGNIAKEGEKTEKSWQAAAQAVQTVGSAMQSIEDPAAKVAGTVMQAIASIALGYAQATTQAASLGPWAWVAFAATGLATMLSTISSIHSATGYANGGMVKGNSYSGDNIPAMIDGGAGGFAGLNAGEVVLNASMQNTLAQNLQGSGLQNLNVSGEISGESIKIVLNRHLKRTGQGEIVTW